MSKKTILIIGVSSFVGSNLAEFLKRDYRIVGTYNDFRFKMPGILTLPCDVLNRDSIQSVMYMTKPDATIYAAGLTSISQSAEFPKLADALNNGGVFNVSNFTERYGSKLIYISSSFIFSGENITFNEEETPFPLTSFGQSKASAEYFIQKSCMDYLIFRCCPLVGKTFNPQQLTFFDVLEKCYFEKRPILADSKIKTGFLDVYFLARMIKRCLDENIINRLVHISSQDVLSRYEFAKLYSKIFSQPEAPIVKSVQPFPFRPEVDNVYRDEHYFKMNLKNVEESLGIKFPSIEESLQWTFKRLGGVNKAGKRSKSASGITYI